MTGLIICVHVYAVYKHCYSMAICSSLNFQFPSGNGPALFLVNYDVTRPRVRRDNVICHSGAIPARYLIAFFPIEGSKVGRYLTASDCSKAEMVVKLIESVLFTILYSIVWLGLCRE